MLFKTIIFDNCQKHYEQVDNNWFDLYLQYLF